MVAELIRMVHLGKSAIGCLDMNPFGTIPKLEYSQRIMKKTQALNRMTGILGVRSREMLPYIVPRLLKTPLTISHADALVVRQYLCRDKRNDSLSF